jgi:hypothetical protein
MARPTRGALLLAALLLTGCGGATTPAPSAAPATPALATTATTAQAAEVNPAGDIPDDQVFVAYTAPGGRFTVKVPEGWGRTTSGGAVTFTDKLNSITLASVPAATAPTVASVRAQELPAVVRSARNYEPGQVSLVRRTAGGAVLATYRADSAPDLVTGKVVRDAVERYEFWQGGTAALLTLSGPVGADNVDPWRIVTDSLRWR